MDDYRFYETLRDLHRGCADKEALRLDKGYSVEEFAQVTRSFDSLVYSANTGTLKSVVTNAPITLADYFTEKIWFDAGPEAYTSLEESNDLLHEQIALLRENNQELQQRLQDHEKQQEVAAKNLMERDKSYSETRATLCFTIGYAVIVTTLLFLTRRAGY